MTKNIVNPYIYPSPAFKNLQNRQFLATYADPKTVTTAELKKLLETQVHIGEIPDDKNSTVAERILALFFHPDILLGQKSIVDAEKEVWLEKITNFTSKNKPIDFTIVGYAYKIPVPMKTNRHAADMGEVLSLYRLWILTTLIKKIYSPGAHMYVFTDGVFGRYNNVSSEIYRAYKFSLDHIVKAFSWEDAISVHELDLMEQTVDNFTELFDKKIASMKEKYRLGDQVMVAKYEGTLPSIRKLINVNKFNLTIDEQMDLYDETKTENQLSKSALAARTYINDYAYDMTFIYHGYLSLRDDLRYMEKLAPGNIRLSVSPKKGRIGILPISKYCSRFPYHGIPVYHHNKKYFTIEYLVDMRRWKTNITPYFWDEDKEHLPFFYSTE